MFMCILTSNAVAAGLILLFWPGRGGLVSSLPCFYRTHVHMGSDHWVALSVTPSNTFLKPCEDLVKTVNVVNVVKI